MRCYTRNFFIHGSNPKNCSGSFDECRSELTCEHSCFLILESNGTRVSAGCGVDKPNISSSNEDQCDTTCVARRRAARYYCCCLGDLCNYEYTIPKSLMASNLSTTPAQPIITHEESPSVNFLSSLPTTVATLLVLFIVIAFVGIIFIHNDRRTKKRKKKKINGDGDNHLDQPMMMPMMTLPHFSEGSIRNNNHNYQYRETDLNEVKVDLNAVKMLEVLGQGRFGVVHRAIINDEKEVAVKVIKSQEYESWQNERYVYRSHMIRHSNILGYVCSDEHPESGNYWLIVEYAPCGSLCDYLKKSTLRWETFLDITLGVVRGLSHLHDAHIAHRDFKSTNILLKSDLTPCITDFGVAKIFDSPSVSHFDKKYHQVGTPRYMAPEVLECNIIFTMGSILKIDVYALSLVLWEILSRTTLPTIRGYNPPDFMLPFEDQVGQKPSIERMVQVVVQEKQRPPIRQEWTTYERLSDLCKSVLMEAWDADSDSRISASCILERVTTFVDREKTMLNYRQD